MSRSTNDPCRLALALPPEFIALCTADGVAPEEVPRGFIADLCGIMNWAVAPVPMATAATAATSAVWPGNTTSGVGYPWDRP